MKRMLINATQKEELRVALVDGQRLFDLDIERANYESKKSNIYKGRIAGIEPSLEAAFVDYGAGKNGFLPIKEVARSYFPEKYTFQGRPSIKDVLKEGQEVIVQIEKEERGNKGAALSTFISLAGSYLVLMPNNPRAGGISRRIEGEERTELKAALSTLELPQGMGLIVRTAGVGKTAEELEWDLKVLLNHWHAIKSVADNQSSPILIHQESDVIIRAIRDYLRRDIGEILIDSAAVYEKAKAHIQLIRPDFLSRVKQYTGNIPLFSHYQVESQIESAFQREVRLPSGGSVVIDPTEALTSIDINSARATKGGDIEETALNTNREAAHEIARQLRLRDLGGLVVIDFIDMLSVSHQREVENVLRDAVRIDRARIQFGRISRFGLLEMSRQRLSPSLAEASHHICPRCVGTGVIRDNESLALSVLRLVEEEAIKDNTAQVLVLVPVTIASYLLNEKRRSISDIEQVKGVNVVIVPNADMETPQFEVARIRQGDEQEILSYLLPQKMQQMKEIEAKPQPYTQSTRAAEEPALKGLTSSASIHTSLKKPGLISRVISSIKNLFAEEEPTQPPTQPKQPQPQRNNRSQANRSKQSGQRHQKSSQQNDHMQLSAPGQNAPAARQQNNRPDNNSARPVAEDKQTHEQSKPNAPQNNEKQQQVKQRRQRRQMSKQVRVERNSSHTQTEQVSHTQTEQLPMQQAQAVTTMPEAKAAAQPRERAATATLENSRNTMARQQKNADRRTPDQEKVTQQKQPEKPVKPKVSITEPTKTVEPEQLVSQIVSSWVTEVVESVQQPTAASDDKPAVVTPPAQPTANASQPTPSVLDQMTVAHANTAPQNSEHLVADTAANVSTAKVAVQPTAVVSPAPQESQAVVAKPTEVQTQAQKPMQSSPVNTAVEASALSSSTRTLTHVQAPMTKAVCHDPIAEANLPVREFITDRYQPIGAGSHSARNCASAAMTRP